MYRLSLFFQVQSQLESKRCDNFICELFPTPHPPVAIARDENIRILDSTDLDFIDDQFCDGGREKEEMLACVVRTPR